MKNKDLETHRQDTTAAAFGIVLEIGFGSGLNLTHYKNIEKLYALEPSIELYNLGADHITKVPFPVEHLAVSAEQIPLADNSINCTVSTWTLCSIPHPETALKEIFRVLKPGGIFAFIDHGESPNTFIAKLQNICTPISKCVAGGCHMNRNIEKLVLDAGFEMQNLEKFSRRGKPLGFLYKGIAIAKK